MALFAERFLVEDDGVVDLATGESIRLSLDPADPTSGRAAICDRLYMLRHPLLLPLVDYGVAGERWYEAHAWLGPLRVPAGMARQSALHLVRFLRASAVALDAATTGRNVRPAIEGAARRWRPVGVVLQPRGAIDAIRTVLEVGGPPGVTAITLYAAQGCGLRSARLQIARIARQAGYLVIDSRFGALAEAMTPPRHLCVLDWLTPNTALPPALAFAAATGGRRHAWIRFSRQPTNSSGAVALEPFKMRDVMHAIYLDPELGPSAVEVQSAMAASRGRPATLVDILANGFSGDAQPGWVHESAPEYGTPTNHRVEVGSPPGAGIARLLKAVAAARALARRGRHARAARILSRCGRALAARGARGEATAAANALGELHLDRGRPLDALAAFGQARGWGAAGDEALRALLGSGRALLEAGRLAEAESAFAAGCSGEGGAYTSAARAGLADVLLRRGRLEQAEAALHDADAAMLSAISLAQGDVSAAARAARRAIAETADGDPRQRCIAHLAALRVHSRLGDRDALRRHATAARTAARLAGIPALRIRVAAEAAGALERTGTPMPRTRRARLLAAAARLPALAAADVRAALRAATAADAALLPSTRDNADLIEYFRGLLQVAHDAPDEETALQAIADTLLRAAEACSVAVRSAVPPRQVVQAGRRWPAEEALTRIVLDGAGPLDRDGLTPEAAEPVTIGGSIIGAIAVQWVAGTRPPMARVRDLLRTAAAAAAPALKSLATPRPEPGDAGYPDELLGHGPAAQRVRDAIRRAALAPFPVLIEGESGSGKELVARAIHARSNRHGRKFCAVNCAALSDDLLEAELFGHARGAFTGAVGERAGLFEEADQGTIFLDEAGELSARAQAKLLRVLQEGEIRRVGENLPRRVDTRIVAATNRELEHEVSAGRFRADLRFRLDVIRITLPPLRDRAEDVPFLAERIWGEACGRVGTRATLGEDVLSALARYDWPGNVRELQNVIASLAVHGPRRGRVPASLLPVHIARQAGGAAVAFEEARLDFERRFIRAALARAGGRRSRAAAQLGLTRQGLAKIIKRVGIT